MNASRWSPYCLRDWRVTAISNDVAVFQLIQLMKWSHHHITVYHCNIAVSFIVTSKLVCHHILDIAQKMKHGRPWMKSSSLVSRRPGSSRSRWRLPQWRGTMAFRQACVAMAWRRHEDGEDGWCFGSPVQVVTPGFLWFNAYGEGKWNKIQTINRVYPWHFRQKHTKTVYHHHDFTLTIFFYCVVSNPRLRHFLCFCCGGWTCFFSDERLGEVTYIRGRPIHLSESPTWNGDG